MWLLPLKVLGLVQEQAHKLKVPLGECYARQLLLKVNYNNIGENAP